MAEEGPGGRVTHFAQLLGVDAAGDVLGEPLVELAWACRAGRAGVGERGTARDHGAIAEVRGVSRQSVPLSEYR